jgi:hypothetical protein
MYGDALTTKERIKTRLGIEAATFDTIITYLILAVTARIEQACGRRFIQAEYNNEMHDGSDLYGSNRFILIVQNAPIQVIESIEYRIGTTWTAYEDDAYDAELRTGLIHFRTPMPQGKQNIRITYTGGFSGYSIGVNNYWFFNIVPTGTVNGSNRTFTLPEDASQVIVYVDGLREASANVTFTAGAATFTLADGRAPSSTIAVDYLRENAAEDSDISLPLDLVEVCEEVVVRLFKRRESDGRLSESFQESSVTWSENVFTKENMATVKNYRRGYAL